MTGFIVFASLMLAVGIIGVVAVLISSNKSMPKLIPSFRNKRSILNASEAATLLNEGQRKEYEVGSVRFYKEALSGGRKAVIRVPRGDEYQHISCPACKFITVHCIEGNITIERDYGKAGEFQRSYKCKYCGHAYRTVHVTPPLIRWTSSSSNSSSSSRKATSSKDSSSADNDLILGATIGYIASETLDDD